MSPKKIVIIGAGITGLATAFFLKQKYGNEVSISLLEKQPRAGGWIETIKKEGFLFEQGPRSCRPYGNGEATLNLIEALSLEDEVIPAAKDAALRYLWKDNKLQPLPTGLWSFFTSPLTQGLLKTLWNEWHLPKGDDGDETIASFFRRRFGNEVTETFIDPLVSGIYAGDMEQLSMKCCFPKIQKWEQERGSVLKGALWTKRDNHPRSSFVKSMQKIPIFSFKNGMESLTRALSLNLKNQLFLNSEVKEVQEGRVILSNGDIFEADHLICTLPPDALSRIMGSEFLSDFKEVLPKASCAVVNLGYRKNVLKQKGFGYLIPKKEGEKLLGAVWDSSAFPQQNHYLEETRVTVMLGGANHLALVNASDDELLVLSQKALSDHLGIIQKPDAYAVKRAHLGIPQYPVNYQTVVEDLRAKCPFTLVGSSYDGVAVNDCIAAALKITDLPIANI